MKMIIIAATATLCFASSSFADEKLGGAAAKKTAFGTALTANEMAALAALAAVSGGVIANGSGTAKNVIIDEGPDPTCNGSDPLVSGVCTGTTTTVTVTGTGTMTSTVTVPVTFTYVPTV